GAAGDRSRGARPARRTARRRDQRLRRLPVGRTRELIVGATAVSEHGGSIAARAPFEPDPRQREVLRHADGAMLVPGGSGTGKTATLRERFARLVEGGADPERVALVVGSRRARDEARRLLLERLPVALPTLTVVTIQGLAFHVVGERFARLGFH